ncbi:MAG: TonB-dependent receptor [Chitinophagia bacterium]|nr:TonB-dependent receptor [Chitinophagia bacterium]
MKKLTFLLILLSACWTMALAQSRVTGRVINAENAAPVEGVTVQIKGTAKASRTNADGNFSITVSTGQTLVFSAIGFATKESQVSGSLMEVSLQPTASNLGEVVVVGYGTQRRTNLTGSVVSLNNSTITKRQVSSASQVLQGLAPGVTVQQQSGRPGADGAFIRIRGESSIQGNSSPLVVIDGLLMPTGTGLDALNQIDPNAIENVTILKDAASTAIYGNRASGGVIVVKTKRASQKGMKVSYNNFYTQQSFTSLPQRVSAVDHMVYSNEAEVNRTGNAAAVVYPQTLIDKYIANPAGNNLDVINTDWLKEVLTNSGLLQNHNVQLASGGEKVNVFTSFTYMNQQGLIPNNSFEKFDLRFNPEFKLNKWLTFNSVLAYNSNKTINPSTGSPEFIIRQAIGLPALGGGKYGEGLYGTAAQTNNRNPIAMAEATGNSVVQGNTLLTRFGFNLRPVQGLDVEAYWGREKRNPYTKTFVKNAEIFQPNLTTQQYDRIAIWPGNTSLSEAWRNDVYQNYTAQATYNTKFGEDHSLRVMAGGQSELYSNYFFGASRQGFINPNQPYLNLGTGARDNNAGVSELALAGFFGRLNYAYKDKYLLELNGRRDGSSRFSQANDKQWGNFGSASAGWIFTKEEFLSSLSDVLSFGKLRGSIGGNGNQNFGSFYAFDAFYGQSNYNNPTNGTNAYFNNLTTLGVAILQFPNPVIGWETSKQWNVGLDLTFKNGLTLTADYYVKTLKDMILPRVLPASAGGLSNPFVNAGNMENKGWEVSANYKKSFKKLNLDVTAMLSDVRNNVTGLIEGLPFIDGGNTRTAPGYALGSYYGYQALGFFADSNDVKSSPVQFGIPWSPVATTGPKPGDMKYADISGPDGKPDGKVDANDRTFLGNAFPRYEYSINLNLSYGNFDLNLFGQGVGRRSNYLSGTGAVPFASTDFIASLLEIQKDSWRANNTDALFPRLLPSGFGGNNFLASSWWIRSASYFRLKNVNLGYTLPTSVLKKAKISSVRVFVSGQNLFTITKAWNGFDPEINNANAEFYPVMRTYTAGLNVNF